jgi:hypothetical protein
MEQRDGIYANLFNVLVLGAQSMHLILPVAHRYLRDMYILDMYTCLVCKRMHRQI